MTDSIRTHTSRPQQSESRTARSGAPAALTIVGAHLYLERDGALLLGKRSPTSAFAPDTWHMLAGHVEDAESARTCMVREAREEAGITIRAEDLDLVHVVHMREGQNRPRVQMFFRPSRWRGEPRLREPDRCTQWRFWPLNALPDRLVEYTRAAVCGIAEGRGDTELGWSA